MIGSDPSPPVRRRRALRLAIAGGLAVLAGGGVGVLLPFLGTKPVLFGPGQGVPVGRRTDLLERFQETNDRPIHVPDQGLFLLHAPGGIIAARQMCTHLRCREIVIREDDELLDCRCHFSQFDKRTALVVGGPAPRPLDLFHLREERGVVLVDPNPVEAIIRRDNIWNPRDLEVHE